MSAAVAPHNMPVHSRAIERPSEEELQRISAYEFDEHREVGWRPRLRSRFNYFLPEHHYEALVDRLVTPGCRWLDVGGGKSLFPLSPRLSRDLADRAGAVVGVDPDFGIQGNPYLDEKHVGGIEDFHSQEPFDLATLRMVAEHLPDPASAVASLARLVRPGGHVVIFTPYRWSPVSIASSLIPNRWHSSITRQLWRTRDDDVFPTVYRMNTRKALAKHFNDGGFREAGFWHLENCQVLQRWKLTTRGEMMLWKALHAMKIRYPETELLGIYERLGDS